MSTFYEDFAEDTEIGQPRGAALPKRWYEGTVELSTIEPSAHASIGQAVFQFGQLVDGVSGQNEFDTGSETFRIGNRKVFHRIWLGFTGTNSDQVNAIAIRQLKQLAYAAEIPGIEQQMIDGKKKLVFTDGKPEPEIIVAALQGRRVRLLVSRHRQYQDQVQAEIGAFERIAPA